VGRGGLKRHRWSRWLLAAGGNRVAADGFRIVFICYQIDHLLYQFCSENQAENWSESKVKWQQVLALYFVGVNPKTASTCS
jgi:hypothetical protein